MNIQDEKRAIDNALAEFTEDCRAKLYQKAESGYRGWEDQRNKFDIAKDLLEDALDVYQHKNMYHLNDIANRAMFLWWQHWRLGL